MDSLSWFLILSIVGLVAWGGHLLRRQRQQIVKLKQSLLAANRKTHHQEATHSSDKAQWDQVEKKLRGFLQLMDTLINTIPNPIYFKDAQGVFQGCNQEFAKHILGLTRDRIIGRRAQELTDQIPADLAAAYQREEIRMVDKAGYHAFETKVQCADGQRREFLFCLAPVIDAEDGFSGSVAVLADLTDKNRAARDRMQKEKLEGVLETAGAVCHELNQPLQALSGYTELMGMNVADPDARSFIAKIIAQVERMRGITDKLQGITRYETTDYAGLTKIIDIHKASAKG